jgi:LysM repeat protein
VPYTGTSKPATASNIGNAGSAGKKTHTVAAGQGLYAIARIYGISVADLRTWNNLSSDNLYEGQQLAVSAEGSTAAAEPVSAAKTTAAEEPAAPRKTAPMKTHKVKRNEGLTSIARQYKVSVSDLRQWNNLSSNSIKVGKVLRVSPPQQQAATIPAEPVLVTTVRRNLPDNATKSDAKRKPDSKSSVKDGEDDDPTGIRPQNQAEAKADQGQTAGKPAPFQRRRGANTVGFPKVLRRAWRSPSAIRATRRLLRPAPFGTGRNYFAGKE